jgi:hypothetical protein
MVFVFYLLTSLGVTMFTVRLAVTCMVIMSVNYLFDTLRRADLISSQQYLLFVPALCCLVSYFSGSGSNTEVIYTPLVLWSFGLLLNKKLHGAPLCAALALSIKYTVVADIAGFSILYWCTTTERGERIGTLRRFWTRTFLLSAISYLAFYAYFRFEGVDLIDEIVVRNLVHASSSTMAFFGPISGGRRFTAVAGTMTLLYVLFCSSPSVNLPLLKGSSAWLILSVVQGCLTRQYYIHYFIPAFVPLVLVLASVKFRDTLLAPLLLCLLVFESGQIWSSYGSLNEYREEAARYRMICDSINRRGYIITPFLAGYRICKSPTLDKFVFPPFYLDEHFAKVSGSGGLATLRAKIKKGDIAALISTPAQLSALGTFLDIGESRVNSVSVPDPMD